MAKSKQIHTVHRPGGWGNKSSGASKVAKLYPTKIQAQTAGRKTAIDQKAEHVIHKLNGRIGEKNSYGRDPRNVRG